jgi:UDP-N-acetylglucosamine 2-epimerase (non-hydrolysing)
MFKVALVFGTRPEAIKMAPLCQMMEADPKFETLVCVSGQHREMLDQVLSVFDLCPGYDWEIMQPGQDLFDITSRVLMRAKEFMITAKPDLVLVHGDTTTALGAALAAFYLGIPVGHVEAGLRTYDMAAPFPEEFNRQCVSKIAKIHFAPTEVSRANLLSEKIAPSDIHVTGNTVVDALFWLSNKLLRDKDLETTIYDELHKQVDFSLVNTRYVLITGHRRENLGDGFLNICNAIRTLATQNPDVKFIYPVHLNPGVQKPVNDILHDIHNVILLPPQAYEPFFILLKNCFMVLTDSGGIQEEAPSLGKPVLVMRETTERPEAVTAGTVKLVGSGEKRIVDQVNRLLHDANEYSKMSGAQNPYGDGNAGMRIVSAIKEAFLE